jgi:hypothetical protein
MGKDGDASLDDLAHERKVWKVEHWGWGVFALILLAALLGIFGEGLLARAKAGRPNSALRIEYDRFVRYQAPTMLKVHVAAGNNALPALWVARNYLDRVEVERISPEPERVKAGNNSLIYIFNIAQTNEEATISFQVKPTGYGKMPVSLGLVDGPQMDFTQFIYP